MSEIGKAVFLSYASQDAEAARRICETLRSGGVEVWFDADGGLEHGDEWDAKIRRQIKECVLFIPVISASTQARHEGYFRIEWDLAAERARGIASGVPFILPVVIDDTREPDALVPDRFRAVQWTRLRHGEVPPEVQQRFLKLWSHRTGVLKHEAEVGRGRQTPPDSGTAAFGDAARQPRRPPWLLPAVFGFTAALALGLVLGLRFWRQSAASTPAVPAAATSRATGAATEADQLIERVRGGRIQSRDDLLVVIDAARRATDQAPDSARFWAMRARLESYFILRGWDPSEQRRQDTQALAKRALAMDPNATDAMFALAMVLRQQGAHAEVEALMRRAIALAPGDAQLRGALGVALAEQGREAEALAVRQETLRLFPNDPLAHYDLALSYEHASTPDFDAALRKFDDAITLQPFTSTVLHKVSLLAGWKGDLPAARRLLDGLDPLERTGDGARGRARALGLLEHQPERTIEAGGLTARTYLEDEYQPGPKAWLLAHAYRMAGKQNLAQAQWRSAETLMRERAHAPAASWFDGAGLAVTLAWLGAADEAGRIMAPLESVARESPQPLRLLYLAYYHAGLGNAAGAAGDLRAVLDRRELLTAKTLPLDPWWDKVRGQPEFDALLATASTSKAETQNSEPPGVSKADPKSVAVLPFANLSGDPAQEYFSDGLTEEILNALARERDLRVPGRSSSFSFKGKNASSTEIAKALNVTRLVEGSVRKSGNRVRISVSLTRAADGFSEELGTFTEELSDIFALQDKIARVVVEKLTSRTPTTSVAVLTKNPDAYIAYLRGRAAQTADGLGINGDADYAEAVRLDPDFALAWARLAMTLSRAQGILGLRSPAVRERYRFAAARAAELAPDLPEAHLALAATLPNNEAKLRELDIAERLRPNDAEVLAIRAQIYLGSGKWDDEACQLALRAAERDPRSSATLCAMGFMLSNLGRFPDAARLLAAAQMAAPQDPTTYRFQAINMLRWTGDVRWCLAKMNECPEATREANFYLARADLHNAAGDLPAAMADCERVRDPRGFPTGSRTDADAMRPLVAYATGYLAWFTEKQGRPEAARKLYAEATALIESLEEWNAARNNALVALIHVRAGRRAQAMAALETAVKRAGTNAIAIVRLEIPEVHVALGQIDEAVAALRAVHERGYGLGYTLRLGREWEPLRGNPKFQQLMKDAEARADALPRPKK